MTIMNCKGNPLPCGCGIKATADLNEGATSMVYKDAFIEFCPLHKSAPDMLKALEGVVSAHKDNGSRDRIEYISMTPVRRAIRKAKTGK